MLVSDDARREDKKRTLITMLREVVTRTGESCRPLVSSGRGNAGDYSRHCAVRASPGRSTAIDRTNTAHGPFGFSAMRNLTGEPTVSSSNTHPSFAERPRQAPQVRAATRECSGDSRGVDGSFDWTLLRTFA